MKKLLLIPALFAISCSVNPSALNRSYTQEFADSVRCATGYKGACFCFVASRQTGNTDSTGIGMTIDQTGKLCN